MANGNNVMELKAHDLKKTRQCADMYPNLVAMKLTSEFNEDFARRSATKTALIAALCTKAKDSALASWDGYMEGEYVALPGVEFREAGDIQKKKGDRFISWFFDNGYTVRSTSMMYAFVFGEYRIKDTVDLLVEKEGKAILMNVVWGTNPYSDKARSPENKTDRSVELLSMMAGNSYMKADACIAYLTSKDDKPKSVDDVFEKKPGKNLAYLSYTEDAMANLCEAMGYIEKTDCETCSFRKECMASAMNIVREKKAQKAESTERNLTPAQEKVVSFKDGRLCVVAVPGAGKTFALVERTKELIEDGVKPSQILMTTFTKKAAAEFADRVARNCQKGVQPEAYTLHALAHCILTEIAGYSMANKKLATEIVRLSLIKKAVAAAPRVIRGVSYDFRNGTYGLYRQLNTKFVALDNHMEDALRADDDRDGIMAVYEIFRKLYAEEGCFEYDELITNCIDVLKSDPKVLKAVHDRWKYFMVDEVQDVDEKQWEMIRLIESGNLVIVGDDDQEIFAWCGGSSRFMLDFTKYFPDGRVLYMEDNFRCTSNIVGVAERLSGKIANRYGKRITPVNGQGSPVYYAGPCNDAEMTQLIVAQIKGGYFKPEDICILGRRYSGLEKLKTELQKNGVKVLPPRNYLIESPIFDMLWCTAQLYKYGKDTPETCLYRLRTYMGRDTVKDEKGLWEKYFKEEPEEIRLALDALEDFTDMDETVSEVYKALTGSSFISQECFQLIKKLKEEEVNDFEDMYDVMNEMVYFSDDTEVEVSKREGYINMLSCHKAKGKEYPCIIINGIEDFEDTEAEIRLAYVAVTRAEKLCIIVKKSLEEAPVLEMVKDDLVKLEENSVG